MRFRVVDLETTGMEPPAEVVEFGFSDVVVDAAGVSVTPPVAWLYRPLGEIPPETMAVHHLTPADFPADMAPATADRMRAAVNFGSRSNVLVAHNCAFERKFLSAKVTGDTPWICTYKAAMHVWPDAPRHGNQVLRYWRGLALDPAMAMPPHRAGPDAWVTAHLLVELLGAARVEQMIAWSGQPRPMPALTFGKHQGAPWGEVPVDYLQWMVGQDMDPDVLWHARAELARRRS